MEESISELQQEIIVGTILGDSCLEFNGYKGTRLQIKQSSEHKDYVIWLYERMKNLCKSGPKQRKDNGQWYFSTRSLRELTDLWELFYPEGDKKIPENICGLLKSPLSVAVWYMDDGTLDYRPKDHYSYVISTNSFSLRGVDLLSKALEENFRVKSKVYNCLCRGKRYPKLYIGADGRDEFLSLIDPFIVDCFSYKLPPTKEYIDTVTN